MSYFYFFFQAEDGIRDRDVTGVQSVLFRSISRKKLSFAIRIEGNIKCSLSLVDVNSHLNKAIN